MILVLIVFWILLVAIMLSMRPRQPALNRSSATSTGPQPAVAGTDPAQAHVAARRGTPKGEVPRSPLVW